MTWVIVPLAHIKIEVSQGQVAVLCNKMKASTGSPFWRVFYLHFHLIIGWEPFSCKRCVFQGVPKTPLFCQENIYLEVYSSPLLAFYSEWQYLSTCSFISVKLVTFKLKIIKDIQESVPFGKETLKKISVHSFANMLVRGNFSGL